MKSPDQDPVAVAMAAVLAYLRERPRAKDTAAGIARWWLPPGIATPGSDELQRALERLVAEGLICAHTLPGGAVIYGRTEEKGVDEI